MFYNSFFRLTERFFDYYDNLNILEDVKKLISNINRREEFAKRQFYRSSIPINYKIKSSLKQFLFCRR